MKSSEKEKNNAAMSASDVVYDVNSRLEDITLNELRAVNGGRIKFVIYETKDLDDIDIYELELSVRASNGLKRAGYLSVGQLVSGINSSEDLKKIRNLGEKSIKEIMSALFVFQYSRISTNKRDSYVKKLKEINLKS